MAQPGPGLPESGPPDEPLAEGYALIDSSYATNGWAVTDAVPDQLATLDLFTEKVRHGAVDARLGHLVRQARHDEARGAARRPFRRLPVHVRARAGRRRQLEQHAGSGVRAPHPLAPTSGSLFGRDLTAPDLSEHYPTMLGDMVIAYLTSDGERPATASEG